MALSADDIAAVIDVSLCEDEERADFAAEVEPYRGLARCILPNSEICQICSILANPFGSPS